MTQAHPMPITDALSLCAFVASTLWQDLTLDASAERVLLSIAFELGVPCEHPQLLAWLELPPRPEEVDPMAVPARLLPSVLSLCTLAAYQKPCQASFETVALLHELCLGALESPTLEGEDTGAHSLPLALSPDDSVSAAA